MLFYLILAFTLLPLAEIWVLLRIGRLIDVGPTIALILLTGIVGAALARHQGLRTLTRISESMARGVMPAAELVEGMMILFAGALLVTPGVITDCVGFSILIPPVRVWLRRRLTERLRDRMVIQTGRMPTDAEFIDVECRDMDDDTIIDPPKNP